MSLADGRCPGCGGTIILDNSKEKANCLYCGRELIIEAALQKCKIDGIASFDALLLAGQRAVDFDEDYDLGLKRYREALALAPNDYRALWGMFRCEIKTIYWYKKTKGFVQIPGDVPEQIDKVVKRYGERAYENAPADVKDYYLAQLNEANGVKDASKSNKPPRPIINWKVAGIALLCLLLPGVLYVGSVKLRQMIWDDRYGR